MPLRYAVPTIFILSLGALSALPIGGTITYGADEAFSPYEWFSEDGKLEGFQIELMRAIGAATGQRINFVTGPMGTIRENFKAGSVNVVSMFDQPVRRDYAEFSKPHSVLASEVFIRIGSKPILSLAELHGKEVLLQRGSMSAEFLKTQSIRFTPIHVNDPMVAMRLLASGKHDCAITTQVGGRHAIHKLGLRNIIATGQPILASNVAFAVHKGDNTTLAWLNEGIDKIKADGTFDEIYRKWFEQDDYIKVEEHNRRKKIAYAIGAVLLALIGVILLWVKILRHIVKTKVFELQYLAEHDSLTGVYNRHYITVAVNNALQEFVQQGGKGSFGILFIDLDCFKLVNDSLGHQVGDLVIKAVAFEILSAVDDRCLVARWGGDEFIVLVRQIPHGGALEKIASRITEQLKTPHRFRDKDIYIGAIIGAVMSSLRYRNADEMLRDADNAMYSAKSDRRARVKLFEPEMHEIAVRSMRLSSDFRKAVENGEIINYYQPIYTLKNAELSGFEALVRWQHPELGLLVPAAFMPILERTDAMRLLDTCVLEGAVRTAKRWMQSFGDKFYISVNVSNEQFAFGKLAESIASLIAAEGIAPHLIRLEITETVIMADAETATKQLEELKSIGLRLLIDDFGTGYSSLSQLASIPADTIKIDRSFVHGIKPGLKNYEIVKAMLALTTNLGLEAVAEGIENDEERIWLGKLGCEYAQGFLLSPPLTEEAAAEKLRER